MIDRLQMLNDWLRVDLEMKNYDLVPASADASFRRYFRVNLANETFIVMDAPPDKENCLAFLDVTRRLRFCGVNVPRVFARDLEKGFCY